MADNTLQTGSDSIKTEDIGGVKYPASKIYLGAHGVDGGPVTASNPLPVGGSVSATVSGTVTALAGTNLNTSLLAVESGGNLAAIAGKDFATQTTLAALGAKLGSLGQKAMAGSAPVVIASDQSAVPVTGTFYQATQPVSASALPLPSGASTEATLAALSAKVAACNTGAVVVSTLPSLPAGSNLVGVAISPQQTGAIYSGTTALTPKFAAIAASASGDNTVVAAVTGKKIRVLRYALSSNGAVNAKWRSATAGDVTGLEYLTQFARGGGAYCPVGLFETTAGEALVLNLSAAVAVGGVLTYVEV